MKLSLSRPKPNGDRATSFLDISTGVFDGKLTSDEVRAEKDGFP